VRALFDAVTTETDAAPVVLFDGVCNLCVGSLPWLLRMDRRGRLRFGTLQSEAGGDLLERCGLSREYDRSMVVVEGETAYTESDAVVRLAWLLGFPWALGSVAALVPDPIRDRGYRWLARNRYDWFGTREACLVPDSDLVDGDLRDRFLG
jgi:predicted DCC family thiol-disulfide oxidoreductase YuxK